MDAISRKIIKDRYRRKYPEKSRWDCLIASSKRLGMPLMLTQDEFKKWFLARELRCVYCDLIDLSLDAKQIYGGFSRSFTVDRRNSDLPYSLENITTACWNCNRLKSDIFTETEFREIAQKYLKPKWMRKLETISAPKYSA